MLQVTEQTVKRLITNANIASSTPRYSDLSPSEINSLKWKMIKVARVALDFSDNGYSGIATYCENRFQAFDDLGSEPLEVKHFGNAADPLGYILTSRYNTRRYDFTHVTTNLTVAEAAGRYGIRVADRLYEMFNIIHLPGNSFRTSPRAFL